MAMVAAAIANGGVLMEPLLSERAIAPDGRVAQRFRPQRFRRVIDSDAAEGVAAMMTSVVERGSGTAAKLQGMRVAGKTGTAERGGGVNQAWFVAFAPAERPRIALAVTVEQAAGTGGEVAAPIAQRLLEVALDARGAGTAGPAAAGGF
jgi:penicillin-binding protein A